MPQQHPSHSLPRHTGVGTAADIAVDNRGTLDKRAGVEEPRHRPPRLEPVVRGGPNAEGAVKGQAASAAPKVLGHMAPAVVEVTELTDEVVRDGALPDPTEEEL